MKGFRRYTMRQMRDLSKSEEGLRLLNEASTSGKDVTIKPRFGHSADTDVADGEVEANGSPSLDGAPGPGVASDIYLDPWATEMWAPVETNLAHELGHATNLAQGTEPAASSEYGDVRSEDEIAAIEEENLVRADLGMPQRGLTHEGGGDDAAERQAVGYDEWRKTHRRLPR